MSDTAVDEALRTGVLAHAKDSLRAALKELEQELRAKNDQITLLVKDIGSLTRERNDLQDDATGLRREVQALQETKAAQIKELADYRTAQLAAIERSAQASEAKAQAAQDAERAAARREQAAQTAESSYQGELERVRHARDSLRTTVIDALDESLRRLFLVG